jgi:hypothetical protein
MRDTWLQFDTFNLNDLNETNKSSTIDASPNQSTFKIVHLFVVGNDPNNSINSSTSGPSIDSIRLEAEAHKDILMIDTIDTYQNLFFKHLTVVNWVVENCAQAAYVVKLDDDVFVNIKKLGKHLITKFGDKPVDSQFVYCNVNEMALPMRSNDSKWYVDYDTYGFDYYPKYCEGFSYITNVATLKLMHSQSKIIPRFWIDDVYFTGLLLYGFDAIKWYDFKQEHLKWSYYDFWDLGNTLNIYELYASFLKLFNINVSDFYKSDYFVILHEQKEKPINYNQVNGSSSYLLGKKLLSAFGSVKNNSDPSGLVIQKGKCSYLNSKLKSLLASFNINLTGQDCQGLGKKFFDFHFYKFCLKLWNDVK